MTALSLPLGRSGHSHRIRRTVAPAGIALAAALATATVFVFGLAPHPAASGPAPAATPAALSAHLAGVARTAPDRQVDILFRLAPGAPQASAAALVRDAGGVMTRSLGAMHGAAARVTAAGAERLARQPGVVAVFDGAVAPDDPAA